MSSQFPLNFNNVPKFSKKCLTLGNRSVKTERSLVPFRDYVSSMDFTQKSKKQRPVNIYSQGLIQKYYFGLAAMIIVTSQKDNTTILGIVSTKEKRTIHKQDNTRGN